MSTDADTFACPTCGQQFTWQPRLAGRKLACACGDIISVPETIDCPAAFYDLAAETAPSAPMRNAVATESNPHPAPVLSYDVLDARRRMRFGLGTESPFRDLWLPIALIAICLAVLALLCIHVCHHSASPPLTILADFSLRFGWDLCVTAGVGIFLAWLLDTSLGVLPFALLKLAAAAITRFTIWALFGMTFRHVGGDLVGFLVSFPALLIMISFFFDLDFREAFFGTALITLLRWVSYFGLWKLLP
ncbi:MAG TPA: hypothetical protein VH518_13530 [Tepidisphaeraceae bacterium]|jgi:hypothetical protein